MLYLAFRLFWGSAKGLVGDKLIPDITLYTQKIGFDKEVTQYYRNLRERRYLACGDGAIDGTDE